MKISHLCAVPGGNYMNSFIIPLLYINPVNPSILKWKSLISAVLVSHLYNHTLNELQLYNRGNYLGMNILEKHMMKISAALKRKRNILFK